MRRARLWCLLLPVVLGCAGRSQGGVANESPAPAFALWQEPPDAGLGGPQCRPLAIGADTVVKARLESLHEIVIRAGAADQRATAVLALGSGFQNFLAVECAVCRLLEKSLVTAAQYDEFLDSVAVVMPRAAAGGSSIDLLRAPEPLRPSDGAVFSHYPRITTVVWSPVPDARSYLVEIQVMVRVLRRDQHGESRSPIPEWLPERGGLHALLVSETGLRFNFVGAQPGRWRVRGLDEAGHAGPASVWRTFIYTN